MNTEIPSGISFIGNIMLEICIHPGCNNVAYERSKHCATHTMVTVPSFNGFFTPTTNTSDDDKNILNIGAGGLLKDNVSACTDTIKKMESKTREFSGGNTNYYLLDINEPKRLRPYQAECEDIIEALEMTFAEGEIFKALWRSCNMRAHGHGKRGQDDSGVYDGDKIAHYGDSVKRSRRRKQKKAQATPLPKLDK